MLQLGDDVYLPSIPQANHTYVAEVVSEKIKMRIKKNQVSMLKTAFGKQSKIQIYRISEFRMF